MTSEAQFPCLVDHAVEPPGKCAITGDGDGPFIDTGLYADEERGLRLRANDLSVRYRIYLSVPYVKYNIARDLLGMVDPEDAPESDELAAAREEAAAAKLALGLLDEAKAEVAA